ncbi:MAG TPA: glycosyltransferase family 4 protein [Solirubrobacteraceae bacterium]|nr:glycosyltransferase family 4 protein [Solirubrobacteraceae bacterium]
MTPSHKAPARGRPGDAERDGARVLMLGMGWFPSTLGGLNRYYRGLYEQLPQARGVVVGPAEDAPPTLSAIDGPATALALRLAHYWLRTRELARESELIDCHFALYALPAQLSGTLRSRPTVFHFHGPWAEENVAAGDSSRLRRALRHALERRVMRSADAHVVLSHAFKRVLVESYRVAPWEVHAWGAGVELERFAPGPRAAARAQLGLAEGAFVAVCVRRLVARMGLEVLLDAWQLALPSLPGGAQLLIVGDGPLREPLRERAARSPLAGSVQVLGRLGEPQLVQAYRAADVAVVPSASLEGFGMVVPEAAACGTPSIVTDVGGLPEAAGALERSLVVAREDAGALARRLLSAAQGELPSRERTRQFAQRFSWPALAERHRVLYRRLLAGGRDPRPRVVYLDHVARLSGGEIALMRVLARLDGVNAHVILGEQGPLVERLQREGVSVEVLPIAPAARDARRDTVRLGGASPRGAAQALAYVARLTLRLRALRPDLVHTNSLKAGVYGSLAARAAGVPLVWHVRDRIAEDYLPAGAVRLVRVLIARLADGVVANSQATLETLPRRARTHAWVVPSPVQIERRPHAASAGAVRFGLLGRIAPWKGQDLFLRAFAAAFAEGRERAVLVGAPMFGEEAYERELHALAAELGLAARVEFRGFREDVAAELAELDVLVHASLIPEPFGAVVLEGMAAGLAVIASDEGGPADVIEHGRTGRLFRSREPGSLAQAMRELRDDAGERARLGEAARAAVEPYRPERIAERLERVYEQVLGARRGVPAG